MENTNNEKTSMASNTGEMILEMQKIHYPRNIIDILKIYMPEALEQEELENTLTELYTGVKGQFKIFRMLNEGEVVYPLANDFEKFLKKSVNHLTELYENENERKEVISKAPFNIIYLAFDRLENYCHFSKTIEELLEKQIDWVFPQEVDEIQVGTDNGYLSITKDQIKKY
ncbi:hypothetical protein ACFL1H_03635 [Nanoarchaeota archaeon]